MKFIIVSKDRASQAYTLIESIVKHINLRPQNPINIIYKTSSDRYEEGYIKLQKLVRGYAELIAENLAPLNSRLFDIVTKDCDCACLLTDDCMFFKNPNVNVKEVEEILKHPDVFSYSYRLGLNTVIQNYEMMIPQPSISKYIELEYINKETIAYNYKQHHQESNYGLHFGWDGMCYNAEMLGEIFTYDLNGKATNPHAIYPQQLENYMSQLRSSQTKEYMACDKHSSLICMNYNSTHPYAQFKTCSLEEMNDRFMNGEVIDTQSIDFSTINSCHQNLPFSFKKAF